MAENAFIYLMQVKNIPWTGAIFQIFLSSFEDLRRLFLMKEFILISFIGGESVPEAERGVQRKQFYSYCDFRPIQLGSKSPSSLWLNPLCIRRHSPTRLSPFAFSLKLLQQCLTTFIHLFIGLQLSQLLNSFEAHQSIRNSTKTFSQNFC